MAQYKKSFYGSSFYGRTTSFSSTYQSKWFQTGAPLTGALAIEAIASLPRRAYGPSDAELSTTGTWTDPAGDAVLGSSVVGSKLTMQMTSNAFRVRQYRPTTPGTFRVKVTGDDGYLFDQVISSDIAGNALAVDLSFPYQETLIEIELLTGQAWFGAMDVGVTDLILEIGRDGGSAWERLNVSATNSLGGDRVRLTGTTSVFAGATSVAFKVHLASSDDGRSPGIEYLSMLAGDSELRAPSGTWSVALNMEQIAAAVSKTFAKVRSVDWTDSVPAGTTTEYRSRAAASAGSSVYGQETALYRKGYQRLRLADNGSQGYVTTKEPVDPRDVHGVLTAIKGWEQFRHLSSLPSERRGQTVKMHFYRGADDRQSNIPPVATIDLFDSGTEGLPGALGNRAHYVCLEFMKGQVGSATPVLDEVVLRAMLEYREKVSRTGDTISALDNGTGRKVLHDLGIEAFGWPAATGGSANNVQFLRAAKTVQLVDETGMPDVRLFFASKESGTSGRNVTSNLSDQVVGRATAVDPRASLEPVRPDRLYWHYHYNGSSVQYPHTDEREMGTDFTPTLGAGRTYRYAVENGWPDQTRVFDTPMDWAEIAEATGQTETALVTANPGIMLYQGKVIAGQPVKLENTTRNGRVQVRFKNGGTQTSVSTHNGNGNEKVQGLVASSSYGTVPWISEEKVYDGYVNLNDLRAMYVRRQANPQVRRQETMHTVTTGETFASIAKRYGAHEDDIRAMNAGVELVNGSQLRIPGSFDLPSLPPEVIFQKSDGTNESFPYRLSILPGSVRRSDGQTLPDETVGGGSAPKPALTYRLVESSPVTANLVRGAIANGQDLIPNRAVRRIISIVDQDGVSYSTGDYALSGNYVSWSKTGQATKEPAAGRGYTVTYTYDAVRDLEIVIDTTYSEYAGRDRLWRSPEVKTIDGVVRPGEDLILPLPSAETFEGYDQGVEDIDYVVEDNDLWVKTSVREIEGVKHLVATLDGEDPRRNWYPTIRAGHYFVNGSARYLYSEPVTTVHGGEAVAVVENVRFDEGMRLQPETTNLWTNSTMEEKVWNRAFTTA